MASHESNQPADDSTATFEQPHNALPDMIIPTLAATFTAYYLSTITEVPWISQASAVTVGSLLLLCIAIYAVRTLIRIRRGTECLRLDTLSTNREVAFRRVLLLALTVAYVYLLESLGFTLATAAFVFLAVSVLASLARWRAAAVLALACSGIGYLVFVRVFQTRFPRGAIENLLDGLF